MRLLRIGTARPLFGIAFLTISSSAVVARLAELKPSALMVGLAGGARRLSSGCLGGLQFTAAKPAVWMS
ncbi:TPA: hypothetical protein ACNV5L_003404 [Citrobacter braakii]